jgi:3-methyl-2-oxobutanoate hydroxymethyltransferase
VSFRRKSKFNLVGYNKESKKVISWITAYDYAVSFAAEEAGIDMILVGDSGGMVQLGYSTTVPVTMAEMFVMVQAVRRGAPNTFVVGDMPFGSYEVSDSQAVENAIALVKRGGCDAVKLEGGKRMASRAEAISKAGILVIGHIGLTPQSVSQFGGYKVQAKSLASFDSQVEDAIALEEAGVSAILLEAIPKVCSQAIQNNVDVTIFGIGAGGGLAGQLLISADALGLYPNFKPKFAKNFFAEVVSSAEAPATALECFVTSIRLYIEEVQKGTFPDETFSYPIKDDELAIVSTSKYWS